MNEFLKLIGVTDTQIDLFEGQYVVPEGMRYNSYILTDEKIAVFDTVDGHFTGEWLKNLEKELNGKTPDYLVVLHLEPDHSASITAFMQKYPAATIVSSLKAFAMMKNYYGDEYENRRIVIAEGSTLPLGSHEITFVAAPMVHWPEVMLAYETTDKLLFSADAFGKFGATDSTDDWACEARRYYFGIVGKYGVQVQSLLKKLADKPINAILPLHGPVLENNLGYYVNLYGKWSKYEAEDEGVTIAYTSVYGHTKQAAEKLAEELKTRGVTVAMHDLARCDMAEAVEDAFRYNKLVLATTTYNGDIFPFMRTFIDALTERNYQNRTIGFIENGSWSSTAAKVMKGMLEKSKNVSYTAAGVKITSAVSAANLAEISALAEELSK